MVIYSTMRNNFLYYAVHYEDGIALPKLNELFNNSLVNSRGKQVNLKCRIVRVDDINRVALLKVEKKRSGKVWKKMLELENK